MAHPRWWRVEFGLLAVVYPLAAAGNALLGTWAGAAVAAFVTVGASALAYSMAWRMASEEYAGASE